MTFDKIEEKFIAEMIISDIESSLDQSQYGNKHGISIQHYLINMINKILTDCEKVDKQSTAVLATFIDWKDAFPRQCSKLGIEAFIKCGVRPSLIPVLINYFQERTMVVKWKGHISTERSLKGGGPQGSYFGILEYLVQSNENANCVEENSRFKFVDDLTILEKINLLLVGMSSYNFKHQVPSDIHMSNLYVQGQNLQTQNYLNDIEKWTEKQKMMLNIPKTKYMLFNFTRSQKVSTRLEINGNILENVNEIKLLGTIITDNLKWDANTRYIVKRAYARMELLRKVATFSRSIRDKLDIYKNICEKCS